MKEFQENSKDMQCMSIHSHNINSRYWYIVAEKTSRDVFNRSSARSTQSVPHSTRSFATLLVGTLAPRQIHTAHAQYRTSHLATSRLGLTIIIHSCLISVIGHHHPMSRTLYRLRNIQPHNTHTPRATNRHERPWSFSPSPTTGTVIELASFVFCVAYLVCVLFCIERSATQPVSPQMFHASRKRERGRMDGGRSGVLQETPTTRLQHDRVRCPSPCPIDQKK